MQIKIKRGLEKNLSSLPYEEGELKVTTDTALLYADIDNKRKLLNGGVTNVGVSDKSVVILNREEGLVNAEVIGNTLYMSNKTNS